MSYLINSSILFRNSSTLTAAKGLFKVNSINNSIRVANVSYLQKKENGQKISPHKSILWKNVESIQKRGMSGSNHVTLWTAERVLSGVLVPLLPLAIITPAAPLDYLLAFTLVLHSHWGIEAIVVDYVRPSVFGPVIPKLGIAMVYGLSALTLGGLFYFIYADVGLGQAIRLLWKI